MKYIIHKNSRYPQKNYSGPSWYFAGIKDRYKESYDTYEEARELADKLSSVNGVGFTAAKLED